jgi:hypothetical protein
MKVERSGSSLVGSRGEGAREKAAGALRPCLGSDQCCLIESSVVD